MVIFKSIAVKEHYPFGYARGAKPGFKCVVEFRLGEGKYETIHLELSAEATHEVVALAVAKAMEQLTVDPASIDVNGAPGAPEPVEAPVHAEDPDFAEVDEWVPSAAPALDREVL